MIGAAAALLGGMALLYHLACAAAVRRFYGRAEPPPGEPLPASLLIPVCGIEPGAEVNWEACCRQDHPEYEVLFGVQDPDDPALPLLRSLETAHPGRARVVLCLKQLGPNRQVSSLAQLARQARHGVIVATDSDMQPGPAYLRKVTAPLADPQVGLVTCGYADPDPDSLGAALAALGRAVDFIPSVLLAERVDGRLRFALGATLALRRDVLDEVGGFEAVLNRIGSDYHLGRLVEASGRKVVLSRYLLHNAAGAESAAAVYHRELRWARTIRMNRGAQFYGLAVTHAHVAALFLLPFGLPAWAVAAMAAGWAVRLIQAWLTLRTLGLPVLSRKLYLLPLRDAFSLWVWLTSLLGDRVRWRGRSLRLRPGGELDG